MPPRFIKAGRVSGFGGPKLIGGGGGGGGGGWAYARVIDSQLNGVASGTLTSGARGTVPINTITHDDEGIILAVSGNQIQVAAGTYYIVGSPRHGGRWAYLDWLYDDTGAVDLITGVFQAGEYGNTMSLYGEITLTVDSWLEMQAQVSNSTYGPAFGAGDAFSDDNTYAAIELWRV